MISCNDYLRICCTTREYDEEFIFDGLSNSNLLYDNIEIPTELVNMRFSTKISF